LASIFGNKKIEMLQEEDFFHDLKKFNANEAGRK
jgi:hypothetical protein